jgi:hypothetical protein
MIGNSINLQKMIIEGKINWVTCSHLGQVYVELVWVRGIPRFKVNGGGE